MTFSTSDGSASEPVRFGKNKCRERKRIRTFGGVLRKQKSLDCPRSTRVELQGLERYAVTRVSG